MKPGNWRETFLGRQAIDHVLKVMLDYLSALETGRAEDVRESLRNRLWKRHHDWTGVPRVMVDRLDEACDDAGGLLRGPDPDIAGAQDVIDKVLDYWLDQGG